jgi:hypothetical protein
VPSVTQPSEDDATLIDFDAGLFDVQITYADRLLPEIVAPPPPAAEAGHPWPTCPPFLPVVNGREVPLGMEIDQIPSEYDDGGAIVAAPDGSPCAAYGWLGDTAIDECLTSMASGIGSSDYVYLPPCNWAIEAGTAQGGMRTGDSRYDICIDLYQCLMSTACGTSGGTYGNLTSCLCGANSVMCDGGGPCGADEMNALEVQSNNLQFATKNYYATGANIAGFTGLAGSMLNFMFQEALSAGCFPRPAGGSD